METPRFLIIEDDSVSAIALTGFLRQFGACDVSSHGFDGVNRFFEAFHQGRPYAVVFLDVTMPVIGGLEVLELLRRIEADAGGLHRSVVVMTTGMEIEELAGQRSLWERCDGYVTKPIDWRSLRALLEQCGVRVLGGAARASSR